MQKKTFNKYIDMLANPELDKAARSNGEETVFFFFSIMLILYYQHEDWQEYQIEDLKLRN